MEHFINDDYMFNLLEEGKSNLNNIDLILEKAKKLDGLTHLEIATLLQVEDSETLEKIYNVAGQIKEHLYGNRVVLFAPLYISDYCKNNCTYCGYRRDNKFKRRQLTKDEIISEVKALESIGHKRLALEVGEDAVNCSLDYVLNAIDWIYEAGDIRRINVNIAATTVENYRRLKEKQIGTYILFQETYHRNTYKDIHPLSLKGDYDRQVFAHHNAMEGGIEDVGGGVLFGLYDYKYEVLGLVLHNESLEKMYNVGFHTVSVPRIKRAEGVNLEDYPYQISDEQFKKIVTILRLALPYVGIILSTRESEAMRTELIDHGVTQISAGSQTGVGGYTHHEEDETVKQFDTVDDRSPLEVIKSLIRTGHLPSYCTACYRVGRTGDHFMEIVKAGKIGEICHPNGIMTLVEYTKDYGDDELKQLVTAFVEKEIDNIKNETLRNKIKDNCQKINEGAHDLYV